MSRLSPPVKRQKRSRSQNPDFTKGDDRPDFAKDSVIPLFFDAGAAQLSKSGVQSAGKTTFETTDLVQRDYSKRIKLRGKHESRPLTVFPDGFILMEAFSPLAKPVGDFCTAIAEPVCRPELVHEYQITIFSLYAAVSIGLEVDEIIATLSRLSKNELDAELVKTMREHGSRIGKLKLVLQANTYFIESVDRSLLEKLLTSDVIKKAKKQSQAGVARGLQAAANEENPDLVDTEFNVQLAPKFVKEDAAWKVTENSAAAVSGGITDVNKMVGLGAKENLDLLDQKLGLTHERVFNFEVEPKMIEDVRKAAYEMQLPLLEEYDFRKTVAGMPDLKLSLRTSTAIRPYQEKALSKVFSNGRARSGIIVLPCGAGKTCVGITAATTVHKRTLVLTTTAVAVDQWRRQFQQFTTIDPKDVYILTADKKDPVPDDRACVLISTYSMFGRSGKRSNNPQQNVSRTDEVFKSVEAVEWGMLIVDEVQVQIVMPAKSFRTVITTCKAHCKIGLTATLVREDGLVQDLQWLIGPKLYEANWQELVDLGHLANVQCAEVWCPMPKKFYAEYLKTKKAALQRGLSNCNPIKLNTAEFLVRFHEKRGDKIIVFSDNVWILEELAKKLGQYFISGKVAMQERMEILHAFQNNPNYNVVFLSKVGDNAIDLPCANVIIQISAHFGARRQEAQRLGRILRPKPGAEKLKTDANGGFNAFFYSLVSRDTQEMFYANKRQQFLVDQGYAYRVVADIQDGNMKKEQEGGGKPYAYADEKSQDDLLKKVLRLSDTVLDGLEEDDVALTSGTKVRREVASLASLSGAGEGMGSYRSGVIDLDRSPSQPLYSSGVSAARLRDTRGKDERHKLFKNRGKK